MAPHPLIQSLCRHAPVVTDGAWGTQLQVRGLQPGEAPDLWNVTHPKDVAAVARAYVEAGAQIILTNTFGANRFRLADTNGADRIAAINKEGVVLSREAATNRAFVFASIGPSGRLLMSGDVSEGALSAAFLEQAELLATEGPDGLVIETMQDLGEAVIATRAAKSTGLPVVACMVFDSGKDKDRTMMGTTPEDAVSALIEAGADVVGANCGQGIAGFVRVCKRLKAAAKDHPVWIKANAGLPQLQAGEAVYAMGPAEFVRHVPAVVAAGATFIGGCCGTTPDFIRAIRDELRPV